MSLNCIQNLIAKSSGKLQPSILTAIKSLLENGAHIQSAEMVRKKCQSLYLNIPWETRIPAICNAMRNATKCGAIIISEDKDHNNFTIKFGKILDNAQKPIEESRISSSQVRKLKSSNTLKSIPKKNPSNYTQDTNNRPKLESAQIVCICANNKNESFFSGYPNQTFVSKPNQMNQAHPDDIIPQNNISWRQFLMSNQDDPNLLSAYCLYDNTIYQDLHNRFNNNFYILSAGWGLVKSSFKLPNYDITFCNAADFKVRELNPEIERFIDFNQIDTSNKGDIIFIGSPEYIPLFIQLTQNLPNRKFIYWKSVKPKPVPERFIIPNQTFFYRYYNTTRNTTWYYELAKSLNNGIIPE
jgi:hypothetical protein